MANENYEAMELDTVEVMEETEKKSFIKRGFEKAKTLPGKGKAFVKKHKAGLSAVGGFILGAGTIIGGAAALVANAKRNGDVEVIDMDAENPVDDTSSTEE